MYTYAMSHFHVFASLINLINQSSSSTLRRPEFASLIHTVQKHIYTFENKPDFSSNETRVYINSGANTS